MHDVNGTPLKAGDTVMVPCKVMQVQGGEDYCNVTLESVHGRRPDGMKETIYATNTGITVLLDNKEPAA